MCHKNEDISESVNSFDTGAIFPTEVGQDLSRNVFVAAILSLERNPQWRKDFLHDSKIGKIFEKVLSGKPKLNFSGPAGGLTHHKGAFAPHTHIHMTRRASLSSIEMQAQGKFSSRWRVKNWATGLEK